MYIGLNCLVQKPVTEVTVDVSIIYIQFIVPKSSKNTGTYISYNSPDPIFCQIYLVCFTQMLLDSLNLGFIAFFPDAENKTVFVIWNDNTFLYV